jgi:recombinational DNA repair protein RecR
MNCKNCGHIVKDNFCSRCGQNSRVDKINLLNFLNEISESVFQVNQGLFFTFKALVTRPGNSIKEFLNGKRETIH